MGQLSKGEAYTKRFTLQKSSDQLPEINSNYTFQVLSPAGIFYVAILEDETKQPIGMHVNVGKAGSEAAAWCNTFSRLVTRALMNNLMTIHDILQEIISIKADKSIRDNKAIITSGPEAVAVAINRYKTLRSLETQTLRRPASLDYGD